MKRYLVLLSLIATTVMAQTPMPEPTGYYFSGVLLTDHYSAGALTVPNGVQLQWEREAIDVVLAPGAAFMRRNTMIDCSGAPDTNCYDDIHYTHGNAAGHGMVNGDYRRVENDGDGPSIARKTAVRGAPGQWAVWAEQINLGPGAKAAFWIGGDNPQLSQRNADAVPFVAVINNNLDVTSAVVQWNVSAGTTGDFLRIYAPDGNSMPLRITKDGAIFFSGLSLNDYIAKQVAVQLGRRGQ